MDRSRHLQRILGGARFQYKEDRMQRVYQVAPKAFFAEVFRIKIKGLEHERIFEGIVLDSATRGDTLVIGGTLVGKTVELRIDVNDLIIIEDGK